ncbi:hypothetical protein BDR26DRAFT_921945 [Obelidium mucronatum]|nr:hypothetical protein BDR26DRAFT_921945 [Obelidium mucronatum]
MSLKLQAECTSSALPQVQVTQPELDKVETRAESRARRVPNGVYHTTSTTTLKSNKTNPATLLERLKLKTSSEILNGSESDSDDTQDSDCDSLFSQVSDASSADWEGIWIDSIPKTHTDSLSNDALPLLPFPSQLCRKVPPLPSEIFLLIDAYLTTPRDHMLLMNLCQLSLSILAPLAYHRPLIRNDKNLDLFLRTVKESKAFESRYYMNMVKILDLHHLPITDDELFEVIKRCEYLESLAVHSARINSTSLCQIAMSLPNLHTLDISSCDNVEMKILVSRLVTTPPAGSLLPATGVLAHLKHVNLSRTRVADADIKKLVKHYPNLETLNLDKCHKIDNHTAKYISMYSHTLKTLVLSSCRINDIGASMMACKYQSRVRTTLENLNLSVTAISPTGVQTILSNCTRLVSFVARECPLNQDKSLPWHLTQLSKNTDVDDDDNDDGFADFICSSPLQEDTYLNNPEQIQLKSLSLQGCNILDAHLTPSLSLASNLESVSLDSCGITLETIRTLSTIESLENVELHNCSKLASHNTLLLLAEYKKLKTLKFRGTQMPLSAVFRLAQRCPTLIQVDMQRLRSIENRHQWLNSIDQWMFGLKDLVKMRMTDIVIGFQTDEELREYLLLE